MIAFLTGQIIDQDENLITLLCRGVGYEVCCSDNTLAQIATQKVVQLSIYTHVREDALQLYGFASKLEKQLFMSLLKVNGIGPKLAIQILSGASLEQIIQAIENKDIKMLTSLPRVGKKTAEQMVLTLKGVLVSADEQKFTPLANVHKEIYSALVHLGFRSQDVEQVLAKLPEGVEFEQGVRESLRQLSQ